MIQYFIMSQAKSNPYSIGLVSILHYIGNKLHPVKNPILHSSKRPYFPLPLSILADFVSCARAGLVGNIGKFPENYRNFLRPIIGDEYCVGAG
ncbi:unnamed protein product, partial [Vitis vinifera]